MFMYSRTILTNASPIYWRIYAHRRVSYLKSTEYCHQAMEDGVHLPFHKTHLCTHWKCGCWCLGEWRMKTYFMLPKKNHRDNCQISWEFCPWHPPQSPRKITIMRTHYFSLAMNKFQGQLNQNALIFIPENWEKSSPIWCAFFLGLYT